MKFIDPHVHLFDLSLGEYSWLKPEEPPFWPDKSIINKGFKETDLRRLTKTYAANFSGFVHIEAGFDNQSPWREIEWLENTCEGNFKSVAYIDLTAPPDAFLKQLQKLLSYKSVVGCRYILGDAGLEIINHENTFINLTSLSENQLSFDLQMPLTDLKAVNALSVLLKKSPELTIIINHAGFPPFIDYNDDDYIEGIANNNIYNNEYNNEYNNWIYALKKLSQFKRCVIKCSGWEMLDRNYETQFSEKVIAQCVAIFGINRVMLASNFPLCLFSKTYEDVWEFNTGIDKYDQKQLEQLCLENTKYWYKF